MKKFLFLTALLFSTLLSIAQTPDYKVVFDLTSKDSVDQKAVIRWIDGITKSTADAKLEVVMYGQGLDLALKDKSLVAADVQRLAANKNISFRVCAAAMRAHNI